MKKSLILGVTGQDGSYMAELLLSKNYVVHGLIRKSATGNTKNFNAEIASVTKKDLKAGQKLDGEGGYCARGRLISSKRSGVITLGTLKIKILSSVSKY